MTKPKITPGAWEQNRKLPHHVQTSGYTCVCVCDSLGEDGQTRENEIANARAIAAVPALLEALEMAMTGLKSDLLYCERNPLPCAITQQGMEAHKRARLAKAKSALTLAGYTF